MKNALLIMKNVLKVTFRKKINIISLLVLPTLGILISLFLNSASSSSIKVGVVNLDKSIISKDIVKSIKDNKRYNLIELKEKEINSKVSDQIVDCAIVIPNDFEEKIIKNDFKEMKIISIKGEDVTAWIKNYMNYYIDTLSDIAISSKGDKDEFYKTYNGFKNQKLKLENIKIQDKTKSKGVTKQSIGFLLVFMMIACSVTANFIIREKTMRTYFRISCSPVSKTQYVLGNVLANLVINIIQISIILLVSMKLLNLNFNVSTDILIYILVSFSFVTIGIGILISAFSTTVNQSSQMANIIITPTCMLSGCLWPIEMMPSVFKKIAYIFPQSWVLKAINDLQYGKTFGDVYKYIIITLCFALVFFIIGIIKMKKDEELKSFV